MSELQIFQREMKSVKILELAEAFEYEPELAKVRSRMPEPSQREGHVGQIYLTVIAPKPPHWKTNPFSIK